MSGRILCGPTWTVLLAAACGCGSDRVAQLSRDPDLARAIAAAGSGKNAEDVARGQEGESRYASSPPVKLLDLPPERPADVANAPVVARIIATVNGEAILEEEVRAITYSALMATRDLPDAERAQKTGEIINAALSQIIERELVLQDMKVKFKKEQAVKVLAKLKEGAEKEFERQVMQAMRASKQFKTEEEIKDFFRAQHTTLEMVRRQWERNQMMHEYLMHVGLTVADKIGHAEMQAYYEGHPEEFKVDDNVVWQDLFVDAGKHPTRDAARAHAEALADRARRGEDFASLARQYDNGDSSLRRNADGIGRRYNEIRPPEAAPVLFRLHDGDVALVEMPTGFHIVRVVTREFAGQLPFNEKVQKQLKEKLRNEIGQRIMKDYVKDLKRHAIIEYAGAKN
jgi:peptidyl-prolyl cis-trans isomerase SurA